MMDPEICRNYRCQSRLNCERHPESRELVRCPYGLEEK